MDGRPTKLLVTTNPWATCTSVGVDNTSVNTGIQTSLKTRTLQRNSAIYFNSCTCHVLHNAAQMSSTAFAKCYGFDAEGFAVDLYHLFDKSTKQK